MMHMLNAYMAYGAIKSELTQAVEYANIMTSARSILRVADDDLTTFERRFEKMALTCVRWVLKPSLRLLKLPEP